MASLPNYLLAAQRVPPDRRAAWYKNTAQTCASVMLWFAFWEGLGALVSIILAVTGWAGQVERVFEVIGASFGPICGAMAADYLLSGRRWAGPRAGFNPAGWISRFFGFLVGAADFIRPGMDRHICPPVAAFVVGFVLYAVLAKAGLQSETLAMPETQQS